jgi:iron(III) transport system ATP-binding protein
VSAREAAAGLADRGGHPVRVVGAGKSFGRVRALDGIDLEVEAGRFLVLLGPSGSGKTTLVRALAGIDRLDEGEIHIADRCVDERRRHVPPERRDLAMVFQDYALWPHLTAADNVGYALRRRKPAPEEARARVLETLDRVGLAELAGRYPHELSGGQQQRVALARAVVARPGLLLFDEPLSNLDTDLRERLRVEISTLTRESGATAVYITHDQAEAFALADVIGVLDQGRLVQLAAPETLYRKPATPFVARFTGLSGELHGTVRAVEGEFAEIGAASGAWRLRGRVSGDVREGDEVRLLVRPAATGFATGPDEEASASACELGEIDGTVVDVAYRGRGYDHVIASGDSILTSVFAARARTRGSRVRLALDPEGCIAYAAAEISSERYDGEITAVTTAPAIGAATERQGVRP